MFKAGEWLSRDELAKNFADLPAPLTPDEALVEASRCLYCYDAPCVRACPTHIDIPKFIRQVLHKNPLGAARTILDANIFGGSCARACPTEVLCEGACVDNLLLKAPVQIGRLQRHACDTARARGRRPPICAGGRLLGATPRTQRDGQARDSDDGAHAADPEQGDEEGPPVGGRRAGVVEAHRGRQQLRRDVLGRTPARGLG